MLPPPLVICLVLLSWLNTACLQIAYLSMAWLSSYFTLRPAVRSSQCVSRLSQSDSLDADDFIGCCLSIRVFKPSIASQEGEHIGAAAIWVALFGPNRPVFCLSSPSMGSNLG